MESSLSFDRQKALLRKELRKKLGALTPKERENRSQEILGRLFRHPKFLEARSLLTYLAVGFEVETRPILAEARRRGKRVYIPRLDSQKKRMWMIEVTGREKLKPNRYGILEPPFNSKRVGNPKELDLAIIPGLGFDREGGRIGRGEGYFDRFLAEARKACKIGLAFECQIVERIPREPHDVGVDEVIVG